MEYGARDRREAIRQLNELRRRLTAAQDMLADAQVTMKRAEAAFDAASDRSAEAESALDAARAERAQARRDRYAAQQAHERASTAVDRLERRVRELSDRLGGMSALMLGGMSASVAATANEGQRTQERLTSLTSHIFPLLRSRVLIEAWSR
jgi:uncharacterized protein (DUF3084 family)